VIGEGQRTDLILPFTSFVKSGMLFNETCFDIKVRDIL